MNARLKMLLQKTRLKAVLIFLYRSWAKGVRPGKIRRYLESHETKKLQIGSGRNALEGWLNTDINPVPGRRGGPPVFLDARKRFPFKDAVFDTLYCEHLIEHLEYRQGLRMLRECFRVLKPGGKIRVSTPDFRFLIALYGPNKTELQKRYLSWAVASFLPETGTGKDVFVINNFFRAWGHKFIYDPQVLKEALESAGFAGVSPQEVGRSDDGNLSGLESHGGQIGDEFNRLETLILEGRKPESGSSQHSG